MSFSNCPFSIWEQFNQIKAFPFFHTILDNCEISSKSVWSRKISWFRKIFFFAYQLCFKGTFLYIRGKFRLKNRVTTMDLLQCKTNFFIYLCFLGRNLLQVKEHTFWEASINIKKVFLIRLHSSTFV